MTFKLDPDSKEAEEIKTVLLKIKNGEICEKINSKSDLPKVKHMFSGIAEGSPRISPSKFQTTNYKNTVKTSSSSSVLEVKNASITPHVHKRNSMMIINEKNSSKNDEEISSNQGWFGKKATGLRTDKDKLTSPDKKTLHNRRQSMELIKKK